TVFSLGASQAIFGFVILAGCYSLRPRSACGCNVVGVDVLQPARRTGRGTRAPGVCEKAIACVVARSIGVAAENGVRRGFDHSVELLILARQLCIYEFKRLGPLAKLFGADGDALLEFVVEPFQHSGFAVQLNKNADLRLQDLWDY